MLSDDPKPTTDRTALIALAVAVLAVSTAPLLLKKAGEADALVIAATRLSIAAR